MDGTVRAEPQHVAMNANSATVSQVPGTGPSPASSSMRACFDDRLLLGLTVFPRSFTCGDAKRALLVSTRECHSNIPVNLRGSTE